MIPLVCWRSSWLLWIVKGRIRRITTLTVDMMSTLTSSRSWPAVSTRGRQNSSPRTFCPCLAMQFCEPQRPQHHESVGAASLPLHGDFLLMVILGGFPCLAGCQDDDHCGLHLCHLLAALPCLLPPTTVQRWDVLRKVHPAGLPGYPVAGHELHYVQPNYLLLSQWQVRPSSLGVLMAGSIEQ